MTRTAGWVAVVLLALILLVMAMPDRTVYVSVHEVEKSTSQYNYVK